MIHTDYPLEAMAFLLSADCLPARYHPLIPLQASLIPALRRMGCSTKHDVELLPDEALLQAGLPNAEMLSLLRRFLALYDPKPAKFREIARCTADPEEQAAWRQLYHLPGVKAIRASLYYRSGFRTLSDLAAVSAEDVRQRAALTISALSLPCTAPCPRKPARISPWPGPSPWTQTPNDVIISAMICAFIRISSHIAHNYTIVPLTYPHNRV